MGAKKLSNFYWSRDEVLTKLHPILDAEKESMEAPKGKIGFCRRLAALTLRIQRVAQPQDRAGPVSLIQRGLFFPVADLSSGRRLCGAG